VSAPHGLAATLQALARSEAAEQVPGFFVAIEPGILATILAMRSEQNVLLAQSGGDGNDVPGVGRDDVGGDEVELIAGVGNAVGGDAAAVRIPAAVFGALDLDAQEAPVVLDGKVVGSGVAPGLDHAQAVFGGTGHEAQLGPLAPHLRVLDVDSLIGHERVCLNCR